MKAAAAANHWTATSEWNTNNVKFLIDEMLQVVDGITQDTGFDKGPKLQEKVANFIGNLFMEHPSYLHLHHFDNVFSAFSEKGVVVSAQHKLIEQLAKHPQTSLERWCPKDVDVIDRNCFRNSRLCINYTEHGC